MGTQEQYWESIEGKPIIAIDAKPFDPDIPHRAMFETISFYVSGNCLRLGTNADTDEITIMIEESAPPINTSATVSALQSLIGKEFFWLWLAENSQGYSDAVMMSFAETSNADAQTSEPAVPQIAFVSVASAIEMLLLAPANG